MADFTITPVTEEADLEAARHLCWAYRDFLLSLSGRDREITEAFYPKPKYQALMDDLAAHHARPQGIILLAKAPDGSAIGCGMSHALTPETAEIKRVFVTDAARGMGVARSLCEALLAQAKADGFTRMVLDTSQSLKAAQRLYDRMGFARRGPYQPIPDDVLPHLVFYEKPL